MVSNVIKTLGVSMGLITGFIVLNTCSENTIMGNPTLDPEPALTQGIPASEMTFVSWNPEVRQKLTRLDKAGVQRRRVGENGGKVGGRKTFGNKVEIPEGAISEEMLDQGWRDRIRITVRVNCVDSREQCGAGVDFLPGQKFEEDVKVTLSWEFLDWEEGEELDFLAYFSEDDGETWYEVAVAEVDYDKKTLSLYVDHFTRFAWAR